MLLLGIDLGTSSIKISVVDPATNTCVASVHYPETEVAIMSTQTGWAEQSPDLWWEHVQQAILQCNALQKYDPKDIGAIGIAYQMHGLVLVNKDQKVIRHAIIWCDGRSVAIGEKAFAAIGEKHCLSHLLNSPGNFTASKLAWVKEHEPRIYEETDKMMLPGDFIGMRFTGHCSTTIPALSEGIFWDFKEHTLSHDVMNYFGFPASLIPDVQPVFSEHGSVKKEVATKLSLRAGIPITYKAGDQINNAFSLHVMKPGEVAATAGTSGVIYGISDQLNYDTQSRINSFAHINHNQKQHRIGVLMCINGAGIFNRWIKNIFGSHIDYNGLNKAAADVPVGSDGLLMLPFGNGAERMLGNELLGGHMHHLDFNKHTSAHLVRGVQEGIAFAFRYGLDIMKENGMKPDMIRAGFSNMFLSPVFCQSFVNATGIPVELYHTDGSEGAAMGAGVQIAGLADVSNTIKKKTPLNVIEPHLLDQYECLYQRWKKVLEMQLQRSGKVSENEKNSLHEKIKQ